MTMIFIIDDDPVNIKVLTDILKTDYEVFYPGNRIQHI